MLATSRELRWLENVENHIMHQLLIFRSYLSFPPLCGPWRCWRGPQTRWAFKKMLSPRAEAGELEGGMTGASSSSWAGPGLFWPRTLHVSGQLLFGQSFRTFTGLDPAPGEETVTSLTPPPSLTRWASHHFYGMSWNLLKMTKSGPLTKRLPWIWLQQHKTKEAKVYQHMQLPICLTSVPE